MTPPLFGRADEVAAVEQMLAGIEQEGGALLLRGEPGIGKSELLAAAANRARDRGLTVLSATGVLSEADLPFAGLHQLLAPILPGIERLRVPQRAALSAAFGLGDDGVPEPFMIGLGALNLLAEAADRAPLVLVVEDAHWLDRPTGEALAFVARRIRSEPIALLAALRDGHASPLDGAALPELRLTGLDHDAAAALVDADAPGLGPELRGLVLRTAAGNPLGLVELPRALGSERPGAVDRLPLTDRLERAFARQEATLPPPTHALLLVAAADDAGALAELSAAASALAGREVATDAIGPATEAGLAWPDGDRLRFRHPLVRSAIYQSAGAPERQAAHAALAETLHDDPDRRAWHRAAAAVGPSEPIAADLDGVAERAARRGAPAVALAALERAARLTGDPARRCDRLLRAAELAFELGRTDLVQPLVEEAEAARGGEAQRPRIAWIRESFNDGVPGDAARILELVAAAGACADPDLRLKLLMGAALRSWWADPGDDACRAVVTAVEAIDMPRDDPRVIAVLAVAGPIIRAPQVVAGLAHAEVDDAQSAFLTGMAAHAVYAVDEARRHARRATVRLRAEGRLAMLAQALTMDAHDAVFLGSLREGELAADEALRLARETAQPIWIAGAQVAVALVAAVRGQSERVEPLLVASERVSVPARLGSILAVTALARGVHALGAGRYDDAFQHLARMFDRQDPAFHRTDRFTGIAYVADAALHSGNREAALAIVGELEPLTEQTPSMGLRLGLLYARPLLTADPAAEAAFAEALHGEPARWPFMRARLQLEFGAWLRRHRRSADSRAPLRAAAETFDALGAAPWSDRAARELRASGEASRRRTPDTRDQLTPQELQIARLAADGLSNREIGLQLYLSPRTVASHLYRLFPKLGVTSRAHLGAALNDA